MYADHNSIPDDHPIFRAIDLKGLKATLGLDFSKMPRNKGELKPKFLLRSLEHYRRIEGDRGDSNVIPPYN